MNVDLAALWFVLLGVFLVGYAILDGFDLGVGILHPLARTEGERLVLMDSIGPFWDGNEVWLVVFGGALFAAFPAAYAAAMTALYLPMMLLLVGLVFRAVSIEFRHHAATPRSRRTWDFAFFGASTLVTFLFGLMVGNSIRGVPLGRDGDFLGSWRDLIGPYPILVGFFAVATFAMHGATYLKLRTEGDLRGRVDRWARWAFGFFLVLFLATTAATLAAVPGATANFRRQPWFWAIPVLNVLAIANIPRALHWGRPLAAFVSTGATIAASTALFGLSLFPNLISSTVGRDFDLTVHSAASSHGSLLNLLIAAGLGMPFVLSYTAVTYWVFRKPTRPDPEGPATASTPH